MSENIKTTILIVDDNQDAADTLAILIRNAGHEALVAYDTESGMTLAHTSLPDFIFHDVGMPFVNGYEAARYAKAKNLRKQFWSPLLQLGRQKTVHA